MHIEQYRPLAPLTTFGIGGPARWFMQAATETEVAEAVAWADQQGIALFVLGGGSNLLIADSGFNGLVLRIALRGIENPSPGKYRVAAGEDWDAVVSRAVADNCAGVECLAGIPGTAGGTPVQNVGAYGQEVASVITNVRAYDRERNDFVELAAAECGFAYRHSIFNSTARGRYIVTRVDYALQPNGSPSIQYADLKRTFAEGTTPSLQQTANAVRKIRSGKGMLLVAGDADCRSAGSFFKNPVIGVAQFRALAGQLGHEPPHYPAGAGLIKLPAAWLIEQAGFSKGYTQGNAGISTRHTLALVNKGNAGSVDVLALRDTIAAGVQEYFGITLEMEPVLVGF